MKASTILLAGFVATVVAGSQAAQADGFKCIDESQTIGVKLYDNVQPSMGTRSPAILVISDGNQEVGSKTLASFTPENGQLTYIDGSYSVLPHFPAAYTQTLGGVKMSQIRQLLFSVKHNFNESLSLNQIVVGQLKIVDKAQNLSYLNFSCKRYLKN